MPAWWAALGVPGLVDIHVHVMPERLQQAVWRYFDERGPLTGRAWPITYRWPLEDRLAHLRALGVRAFPTLLYAHKPEMAAGLNDWALDFAAGHADVIPTATLFPEPGVASYVSSALDRGARVWKVHVQVGAFDPSDPLLDEAWGLLADARALVVIHAGSGPTPGRFTGPGPVESVLRRHPRLRLVLAHMGMPEYDAFLGLAERYADVHLDTTMCFTDFSGGPGAATELARSLAPRLDALADKVLLGTDFPTIPHTYAHQLEALERTGLGPDWLAAVVWRNGARLLGL